MMTDEKSHQSRHTLHEIIFEADTPAGKLFDILLIVSIVISVVLVMLDSVSGIRAAYGRYLYVGEWGFTILFTVMILVVIFGSLMYLIEDPDSGFTSIPQSIYWAIVTLTTVGYGEISPKPVWASFYRR
jgi:voltage-gated potassium channel Kch